VSLANAVAMARCAKNLVLLGDQMQLEATRAGIPSRRCRTLRLAIRPQGRERQPARFPVFHAVVPLDYGLFLGESHRMHPSVCRFISESIYEGRLGSHLNCAQQKITVPPGAKGLVICEAGIVFSGVEHDGDIQQSDEEVERIKGDLR